ncbi:MAG: prolyl oligopeptidase family serine peptidase, partial [Deltaproteobacteria bacterium]|nr:prolyl oligopeptidase family serine peptidase [Deltaproteobacteria bacterium]
LLRFSLYCFIYVTCVCSTTDSWAFERKAVSANGLVATYYYKKGVMQQPPVIFLGGSSGGNFYDNYQNYAEDLVNLGYAVLNLAYFDYRSNGKIPNKLQHIPLEYFKKAMDWMEDQPQTSKGQFAVVGNSRGGEAVLLLAIQYPKISTVIALVSSAYVGGAYDQKREVSGSAWTFEGKEIPYVDYQKAVANYNPWWEIIYDYAEIEPFAIPVENMSAAVLLLSGEKDEIWPSTEMSRRIIQRLEANHYNFPFQHISYNAGHNIRAESWPDLLQFLNKHYPRR